MISAKQLNAGLGFAVLGVGMVSIVALMRGGLGFSWQSVLGAAAGGFLAGVLVDWIRQGDGSPSDPARVGDDTDWPDLSKRDRKKSGRNEPDRNKGDTR